MDENSLEETHYISNYDVNFSPFSRIEAFQLILCRI